MKFKNYEVRSLGEFLSSEKLSGRASRMRTRFVTLLNDHLINTIEKERVQLIQEYAEKDEEGSIIMQEDGLSPLFSPTAIAEFNQEYFILMNEDFTIEVNDNTKEMFLAVADVILESKTEVFSYEAVLYDSWCEKFEEVLKELKGK